MPAPDPHDTLARRKLGFPKSTGSLAPIPGRCGAKLSFTGTGPENPPRYCKLAPAKGKSRCPQFHNGNKEQGLSNPQWKNGTTSAAVPRRIAENYERLLHDDQLLSLRTEIARQRAYYQDLEQRGEDGAVVSEVLLRALETLDGAWRAFKAAAHEGATVAARRVASDALAAAMAAVNEARGPAATEVAVRKELRETWTVLGSLTAKENQQVERLYNMITTERAMALRVAEHTLFIAAMEKHVPDRETQNAIRRDVAAGFDALAKGRDRPVPIVDVPQTPVADEALIVLTDV